MGLLGRVGQLGKRIGREWNEQAEYEGGSKLGSYLAGPPVLGGLTAAGFGGGAMALDAANGGGDDPYDRAREAAMIGGLGMGGVAALASGTMGGRQLIIAIARALKKQRPDLPDEAVIQQAQSMASKPDAWETLKAMGIDDPRKGLSRSERDYFNSRFGKNGDGVDG